MVSRLKKVFKSIFAINSFKEESYSQSGEDVIVKFIFRKLEITNPTYIDIGAHHPYKLNNTALFYKNGSRGLNIEPDPTLFKTFLTHRKGDINLNIGIGTSNTEAEFYVISSPTLNTFSKKEAENYKSEGNYRIVNVINVPVMTLSKVLEDYFNGNFPQFLTLDAEGIDELVIKSIDFQHNYPLVICVETISFSTSGHGKKNTALIEYIKNSGYMLYADTYINSIFVREDKWRS